MEALPNLICGKVAVGEKDNLPPDNEKEENNIKGNVNITGTFTPLVRIEETIVPD